VSDQSNQKFENVFSVERLLLDIEEAKFRLGNSSIADSLKRFGYAADFGKVSYDIYQADSLDQKLEASVNGSVEVLIGIGVTKAILSNNPTARGYQALAVVGGGVASFIYEKSGIDVYEGITTTLDFSINGLIDGYDIVTDLVGQSVLYSYETINESSPEIGKVIADYVKETGNAYREVFDVSQNQMTIVIGGQEVARFKMADQGYALEEVEVVAGGNTLYVNTQTNVITIGDGVNTYDLADPNLDPHGQQLLDGMQDAYNADMLAIDPNFGGIENVVQNVDNSQLGFSKVTSNDQVNYAADGFNFSKKSNGLFSIQSEYVNASYTEDGGQILTYIDPSNAQVYSLGIAPDGTKYFTYSGADGDFAQFDLLHEMESHFRGAFQRFEAGIGNSLSGVIYDMSQKFPESIDGNAPGILQQITGDASLRLVPPVPGHKPEIPVDQTGETNAQTNVAIDETEIVRADGLDGTIGGGPRVSKIGIPASDYSNGDLLELLRNAPDDVRSKAFGELYDRALLEDDVVTAGGVITAGITGVGFFQVSTDPQGRQVVQLFADGSNPSTDTALAVLVDDDSNGNQVLAITNGDGTDGLVEILKLDDVLGKLAITQLKIADQHFASVLSVAGDTVAGYVADKLADGNFIEGILYNAALKSVAQNFSTFSAILADGYTAEQAVGAFTGDNLVDQDTGLKYVNQDILTDTFVKFVGATEFAIANFIVGEVAEAIDIGGIGGEIITAVGNEVTVELVSETFDFVFKGLDGTLYNTLFDGDFDLDFDINPASIIANIVARKLAGDIIEPESEMAALFGSVGSAVGGAVFAGSGSVIGETLASKLVSTALSKIFSVPGSVVPIIGTAIGYFVGQVLGTALGNLFGDDDNPSSWGFVNYNENTNEYYFNGATENDGGGLGTGTDLATALANGVNQVIAATGGQLRSTATAQGLTIGWKEGEFLVVDDITGSTSTFDNAGEAISFAAFKLLKSFDLVGGPNVVMRAWHNSDATNLQEFREDIQVAEAFLEYLQNPTGILALMMDQPDSDLAQAWAAILQRAAELELHLPHEKDFDGGWNEIIAEVYDLDVESLASLDETTLTVTDPVTGEETVFHHFIGPGYEIVRIEGTDGDDIINVVVDGPSITYVDAGSGDDIIEGSDERDIIFGGEGDDTVNGNGGDDWINGGAGNDTLNGNNGLDFIIGGSDDDVLTGGDHDDHIYGGFGNDILTGGAGQDDLYGGDGDDVLHGDTATTVDYLYGDAGNDTIYGYTGDFLIGGKGDDLLIMGSAQGNKGIRIARGDGHDTLQMTSIVDQYIAFDSSIGPNDLWFHYDPADTNNLIISVLGEDQSIKVLDFRNYDVRVDVLDDYYINIKALENSWYAPLLSVQPTGQYNVIPESDYASMSNALMSVWYNHRNNHRFFYDQDTDLVYLNDGDGPQTSIAFTDIPDLLYNSNSSLRSNAEYMRYFDRIQYGYENDEFLYRAGDGNDYITTAQSITGGVGDDELVAPDNLTGFENVFFYGGAGNDILIGGKGSVDGNYIDTLVGGAGEDYIFGSDGNDRIWGGEGDDIILGAEHDDLIFGNSGNDIIDGNNHDDIIHGGDGDDLLYGDDTPDRTDIIGDDVVSGDDGNDTIYGGQGEDTLDGGADDDIIYGGGDNDVIIGGTGNDELHGEDGDDTVTDDDGDDELFGGDGNDRLTSGMGNDSLDMGAGNDFASGGEGDDTYTYTSGDDTITEIGTGIDRVIFDAAWSVNDVLVIDNKLTFTNSTTDSITFNNIDLIEFFDFNGNTGLTLSDLAVDRDDTFIGTSAVDSFDGNLGSDTVNYSASSSAINVDLDSLPPSGGDADGDTLTSIENIIGTGYDDQLRGGNEDNTFFGGNGDDTLKGRGGNDILNGGVGADYLEGNSGDDDLYGGLGADTLKGSGDVDRFIYKSQYEGGDIIQDFNPSAGEKVDLFEVLDDAIGYDDTNVFSGGFLRVEQNLSNVELYLDMDGSAYSGAETLFITFEGLNTSDITSSVFILPTTGAPIPTNTAPNAVSDNASTSEDTAITINVLANDSDAENDPLAVSILSGPANGSVQVNGDDTITYTPNASYTGGDSFTYQIDDGNGGTDSASVSLTVNAAGSSNTAPIAQDDSFSGNQDATITGNVLADNGNGVDSDPDGDTLSVTADTISTTNGSVTISSNGDFTYTPNSGYTGSDSFNYTLLDGNGGSNTATVNLTLNAVSGITGTSGDDSITGTTGDDVIYGLAGNDSLYGDPGTGGAGNDTIYGGDGNDYISAEDGNDWLYGDAGDDTLKGRDGEDVFFGGDGSDYLEGGNDDDTLYGGLGVDDLKGSSGSDTFAYMSIAEAGDTIQDFNVSASEKINLENVLSSAAGFVDTNAFIDGYLSAVQNNSDTEIYVDMDGSAGSGSQVLLATLLGVTATDITLASFILPATGSSGGSNNAPIAQDDSFSGDQDVNITGNLLADNGNGVDSDPDGDSLSVTAETINTTNGSVTILSNGDFTYTPDSGYTGSDSFNYTLLDGNGGTDTGAVNLTLNTTSGITGTSGDDSITGTTGDDTIHGLAGNDNLDGDAGNDTIYGGDGNDTIIGRDGNDILYGGDGDDTFWGNDGDDTLYGGLGADNLKGSAGVDKFVYQSMAEAGDTIQDFNVGAGEAIDISDVLIGYDPLSDVITDFVQITDDGTDSTLAVDADGGADNFVILATLLGVTGITDEVTLEDDGNLVTV